MNSDQMEMSEEEHRERHVALHKNLDELLVDFIDQTGGLSPGKTALMEFMEWSYQ